MGRDRPVAGSRDDRVDVGGAPVLASGRAEQIADWPVVRDRIADRPYGPELVPAVGCGHEDAAQVERRLIRVLGVVQAVAAGLPDIDARSGQRRAVHVSHQATYQGGVAVL